jgi:IclR family KDG regulon transcriptional repressor
LTSKTCFDKTRFKKEVLKIREEGIAFDDEEYIEGVVAFVVPLKTYRRGLQIAIWAVGLKRQVSSGSIPEISDFLRKIANALNQLFSPAATETGCGNRRRHWNGRLQP